MPYASLESVIEENKELYYKALRQTRATLKKADADWEKWCVFFLKSLKKQKDKLAAKLERERILAQKLAPLANDVLRLLKEHERLSIAQIEALTGANRNTLKVRLRTRPRQLRRTERQSAFDLVIGLNREFYSSVPTQIYRSQSDPTISFLHEPGFRRFSLALDLS